MKIRKMSHTKHQLIEDMSNKANSWNSPLAKAIMFDPESEKLKVEVLRRAKAIRDQAIEHFAEFAASFSITRFMVDGRFWMSTAKAKGYTFTENPYCHEWVDGEGYVQSEWGEHYRCNETTEVVFIGPTQTEMLEFFKK